MSAPVFPQAGTVAVWKPVGMTSHDVVALVRRVTGVSRVGHGGTLDPLACGVLVVAIGREATKGLDAAVKGEKEYAAEIRLGATSVSGDREGPIAEVPGAAAPARDAVAAAAEKFVGNIMQVPPAYSALKLAGKPAYEYARAGKEIAMKAREVEIREIEIVSYAWPDLVLRVVTGPGVYIRSLARDIGAELGTGGYLFGLARTRVGNFRSEGAIRI